MTRVVSLKLLKIQYGGDSIGDDIRIEIEVGEELFIREQEIKAGEPFEFNQEIKKLQMDTDTLDIPVRIKITEEDILFDDSSETKNVLHINTGEFPQTFNFEI